MAREAVAGEEHHVDVERTQRNAFVQHVGTLVDHRGHVAAHDFLIAEGAGAHASALALGVDDGQHLGVFHAGARAFRVQVPAALRLLAEPAALGEAVGHLHVTRLGVACGGLALARGPADVAAGQVRDLERTHRVAELAHRLVDLVGRSAVFHQVVGGLAIDRQDAVADETVAHAGAHGHFLELLGEREAGGHRLGAGLRGHHDLEQLHDVGRREEVQSDHVRRARDTGGDFVDVEVRGVGGQHGAGLAHAVEFGEDGLLDTHLLEHRFDDQVCVLERVVGSGAVEARHHARLAVGVHAPLLDQAVVDLLDVGAAARQAGVVALDHRDRQARVEHRHRDARAHGAAADDAGALDRARLGGLGLGHLSDFALGEEHVGQTLVLRTGQALLEQLALELRAFGVRPVQHGFHGLDDLLRRDQPARLLGHVAACGVERGAVGIAVGERRAGVTAAARRRLAGSEFLGIGQAVCRGVVDELVDQAQRQRFLGTDAAAGGHHVERGLHADQTRRALRAAGAGQQAQQHLGQAELRVGGGQAVVRGHGHFESAAERSAPDGGDHRLGRCLDRVAHLGQAGRHRRLAKFTDVGTAEEERARAQQQDGLHRVVGLRSGDGFGQAPSHVDPQGVDRRVVDGHQQDAITAFGLNEGGLG